MLNTLHTSSTSAPSVICKGDALISPPWVPRLTSIISLIAVNSSSLYSCSRKLLLPICELWRRLAWCGRRGVCWQCKVHPELTTRSMLPSLNDRSFCVIECCVVPAAWTLTSMLSAGQGNLLSSLGLKLKSSVSIIQISTQTQGNKLSSANQYRVIHRLARSEKVWVNPRPGVR